jgi:uncharacterized protein YaeQ
MALASTLYTFDIDLADADRGVYESQVLRVARHPSEAEDFLVTRLLAYCREFTEGISFSSGLSAPDEPAIAVRDPTGALRAWIDVGVPDAARVHRASKAAPRVAIYTHKPRGNLIRALAAGRIHRVEALELFEVDRELIARIAHRLGRRMKLAVSFSGGRAYVAIGDETIEGALEPFAIAAA